MIFRSKHIESIFKTSMTRLWQSKAISFCSLLLVLYSFVSCNPEVEASTKNVHIDIQVEQVSAGYAQVTFSTDKRAFYLAGIQPVREGIDPQKVAKQFMLLALDSAYVDYLYWRNQQLQQLTPFVADFASHSLQYGTTEHFYTFLDAGCKYWVFAFVVDHTSNKPAGHLFVETIQTNDSSTMPISFHYRVEGAWDYIYPMDSVGEVLSHIPWVGETVDSVSLRLAGWNTPAEYFFHRFVELYNDKNSPSYFGIAARENNGSDEGGTNIQFEIGKTYYTGMATLDAPIVYPLPVSTFDIYRFTWMGDSTNLYFTPEQGVEGEW